MAKTTGKRAKGPKALKDDVVRMRISSGQKQGLMAAAERDGLELSAWLRQVAFRAAGLLPDPKNNRS